MAIPITVVGVKSPTQPSQPMRYYPRAVQSGVVDLDMLAAQISSSTTVTETDCYAVILSLVHTVSKELEEGKIVRLGHLGTFQVSVKGTGCATAEEVKAKNVTAASIVFRPGLRFKKMLKKLQFVKKK
jgi:predicted histone-like DNA-binding protein